MKREYLECCCHTDEHLMTITYDLDEKIEHNMIYFSVQLIAERNVFKRIWKAIRYVLGYQCKYGHWDTPELSNEAVDKLDTIIQTFKQHNQWYAAEATIKEIS